MIRQPYTLRPCWLSGNTNGGHSGPMNIGSEECFEMTEEDFGGPQETLIVDI